MAIQGSGTIDVSDLRGEYGGSTPDGMSEYYRATVSSSGFSTQVGPHNTGVPTSGPLDLSDFYSTTDVINLTVSTTVDDYNVFTAAGFPSSDVSVYLNITSSGVCRASTTGVYGLTISGFTAGSYIFIRNEGYIVGKGGNGGKLTGTWATQTAYPSCEYQDPKEGPVFQPCITISGDQSPTNGGPAMSIQSGTNIYINNSGGVIGGGGGGGGAGGISTIGCTDGACNPLMRPYGFGCGGGGAGYGSGGTGYSSWCNSMQGSSASSNGTLSGGAGSETSGNGGSLGNSGVAGSHNTVDCYGYQKDPCNANCLNNTQDVFYATSGGSAGAATSGASNATWYVIGTRYGTVG